MWSASERQRMVQRLSVINKLKHTLPHIHILQAHASGVE